MTERRLTGGTVLARRSSVGWLALASLALGLGVSGPLAAAATPAAPAACPAVAPTPAAVVLGQGPVLSGGVAAMRLCRYGTLPARRLEAQHLTRSHKLIADLYTQLNALLPVPAGPTSCPSDNGSEIVLLVRYRSGRSARVTIALTGCRTVTRGRVARSAEFSPGGPALLARLERLTR